MYAGKQQIHFLLVPCQEHQCSSTREMDQVTRDHGVEAAAAREGTASHIRCVGEIRVAAKHCRREDRERERESTRDCITLRPLSSAQSEFGRII